MNTEQRYQTPYGTISFEALHSRCRPYAAYLLRSRLGMENNSDVDDCLQVGFFKLWQKLQKDPEFLADKTRFFVPFHITRICKAQRYAHIRHQAKVAQYTGCESYRSFTPSANDIDTRIDLTNAIEDFANTEPDAMVLLAYDYVGTNVTATEAASVYGVPPKRIYNYAKHARAALVARLPHYRSK